MNPVYALALGLALSAGGGSADPNPWDGHSVRRHVDAVAGVAFDVPLTQALIESRHSSGARLEQMTDVLTLSGPGGFEVEIGIWANAAGLSLEAWIPAYVPFLLTADRAQFPWHVSHGRVRAQLFEHPRTGQQFGRRTAIFALGDRMVRVTCINKDDPRAAAVFESVIESFEVAR